MSYHLNLQAPDRVGDRLKDLSERTGLNVSELARRIIDFGLQGRVLDELVPAMSGQLLPTVASGEGRAR